MLCALNLYIFIPYALKVLILVEKHLGLFSRVLKIRAKTQFKEAIQDLHNKILDKYNDEKTKRYRDANNHSISPNREKSVRTDKKNNKTLFLRQ